MKTNSLFLTLSALALLTACTNNCLYNEYQEVDAEGWHQDSALVFEADIQDTVSPCDLLLQIRHTERYPYQNFWLFVDSQSPAGIVQKDTLECYLADNSGKWLGQRYFSLHEMSMLYLRIKRFPTTGVYRFQVSQAMRDEQLTGISSIGLCIQKRLEDGEE
ncbi:MAG: gliding motility lipoprotein GldH [Paludibacteraceae bacterium]|nr:gliding motility lipoprotein GldH [Paludibacteraceae bacterium]